MYGTIRSFILSSFRCSTLPRTVLLGHRSSLLTSLFRPCTSPLFSRDYSPVLMLSVILPLILISSIIKEVLVDLEVDFLELLV